MGTKKDATTKPQKKPRTLFRSITVGIGIISLFVIAGLAIVWSFFEQYYRGRVYSRVTVAEIPFGGKTPEDVKLFLQNRSIPLSTVTLELRWNGNVATVSGTDLGLEYDASLSATQAYLVGRSKHPLANILSRYVTHTNITPFLHWNYQVTEDMLSNLAVNISVPVQDALFRFENGKVTLFKPSRNGRRLNIKDTHALIRDSLVAASLSGTQYVSVPLAIDVITPSIATDQVNSFGIRELIGTGYSEFHGSIPGRIHNITLAASRLNGVLIKPGDVFSFNNAVGDISAATGYQTAYIIKDGRTVLGDGGGVCQVSTTLFRAALNAGLPVVDRHAHAYRVHYYEEAGYKAGVDATVFAPSVDLQIKNDTPAYILIQTKTDVNNLSLTFELYGTADGRKAEILNHNVWGVTPPPPDLYQDDPTLPKGTVKQVDFAAWGAKASFQYKVTRSGEVLQDTTFYSNYRPWQAVYLKGTKE